MTPNELDLLKAQADQMGISYKSNIGVETLRAKIKAKLDGVDDTTDDDNDGIPDAAEKNPPAKHVKTKAEVEQGIRDKQGKEQLALIRVRISCLNPMKAALQGEIVTVANKFVGTVRKFIPFGEATDNGYHVPLILLNELKARKFNSVKTKKGDKGAIDISQRLVPEFAIEELEPLTMEELGKLAASQMAAQGLG
jgi:hypothetical protein